MVIIGAKPIAVAALSWLDNCRMARLPQPLPSWVAIDYLGDAIAWAEAKRQCKATLYEWARSGEPHTYTELTQRVTAIPWPEGAHTPVKAANA